jgi:predicted P-loop ATPase
MTAQPDIEHLLAEEQRKFRAEQSRKNGGALRASSHRSRQLAGPSIEDLPNEEISEDYFDEAPDSETHDPAPGENWRAGLIRSKATGKKPGAPKPILANAITALRQAPEWFGVLGFNEFSLGTVALRSAPWGEPKPGVEWTDHEDRLTANWLQHHGIFVSMEIAGQAVQAVAKDRPYHPVREYLDRLEWDETPRIDTWLSLYLGADANDYTAAVGARWLISAVARIYQPGAKVDCCLILEGPQGLQKSKALKTVAGDWFTDEIAELGSKDASLQTRGVWIIEIAELDSMRKAETGKVKAFMSRSTDRFRPPYGKRLIESPRQCVFAGSVNHSTYLRDETGGRRFWPVACTSINIEGLARDRDQLWAEAVRRYVTGAVWWLDSVELNMEAEQQQAARFEGGPWDELISRWVIGREMVCVDDVLARCIEKPKANWTQADKNTVARCLRALKWERFQERTGDIREWRYRRMK